MAKRRRKIKPMDDEQVLRHLDQLVNDALDFNSSELSKQRSEALKYYFGEPFGNERPGKSAIVSRDVQETVDWIMPSLMKVFTSGGQVVKYEPQTAEDVEQAEQETEYVNYLFMRKNEGFKVMFDWFQDTLMMKTGVVKVYVEEVLNPTFERFSGLSEEMVADILADPDTEILAQSVDEDGTYSIKIRKDKKKREIKVTCIKPENFLVDRLATCIDDARFLCHREKYTVSDLRLLGVPEDVLDELPYDEYEFSDSQPERLVRDNFDMTGQLQYNSGDDAEANREVWASECYTLLDVDGDGISELRRILYVGDYIISNEPWDCRPFADLNAYRIAHKFHGMSVYDKIRDIQEIRSVLMRNIMDNIYRTNQGRSVVLDGQVNLEDLLTNEAAGIVRVKAMNSIMPLETPQLSGEVYGMLDRLEADRGKRTGITDRTRGLDQNTLHSNQAAMSVNQLMTAAEQQIDLIARMFAETGVKRLFQLLHDHAIKYQNQEEVFQLRGKWVAINPANWRERSDLTVTVGIGNMNKDQQMLHLMRIWEMAQAVVGGGGLGVLVSEQNLYNILKEVTENAGYKDPDRFWTNPDSPEAQQAKAIREQKEAQPKPEDIKAQADAQRAQSDAMAKQAEAQMKQVEAQIRLAEIELKKQEAVLQQREMALKEAELQLERDRFTWERARNEAEYHLEATQARAAYIGDGKVPETKKPSKAVRK